MSWFSDFFNPPAAGIGLPQNVPFGGQSPSPFGFTSPQLPSPFAPTGQGGAEGSELGGIGNLGSFNTFNIPAAEATAGMLYNNPYSSPFVSGSATAAGLGESAATGAFGAGGGLYGLGGAVANTAFDPQSALYTRTAQQLQDQTRAGLEARGVDKTPYGAGIEADVMKNFNIDWENQQLQREIAGGNAAGGLFTQGAGMQAGAAPLFMQSAGYPYNAINTVGQGQFGALTGLGQFGQSAATLPQQQIGDLQSYLQWATTQQGLDVNTALQQYQAMLQGQGQAFGQQQTAGFTDPFSLMTNQQGFNQNQFTDALSRDAQAFSQQQSIMQGLGGIAGLAGGYYLGGVPGAAIGGGVLSGKGIPNLSGSSMFGRYY